MLSCPHGQKGLSPSPHYKPQGRERWEEGVYHLPLRMQPRNGQSSSEGHWKVQRLQALPSPQGTLGFHNKEEGWNICRGTPSNLCHICFLFSNLKMENWVTKRENSPKLTWLTPTHPSCVNLKVSSSEKPAWGFPLHFLHPPRGSHLKEVSLWHSVSSIPLRVFQLPELKLMTHQCDCMSCLPPECFSELCEAMVFPVVMYRCESWTVKIAECWRIAAFELWCWRRLWESLGLQGDPTSQS